MDTDRVVGLAIGIGVLASAITLCASCALVLGCRGARQPNATTTRAAEHENEDENRNSLASVSGRVDVEEEAATQPDDLRVDAVDVWRGASSAVHLHAIDAPH